MKTTDTTHDQGINAYIIDVLRVARWMILNFAQRHELQDASEDLIQDAAVVVLEVIDQWREQGRDGLPPRPYLQKAIKYKMLKMFRRFEYRVTLNSLEEESDYREIPVDELEQLLAPTRIESPTVLQRQGIRQALREQALYHALSLLPLDEQEHLCHTYGLTAYTPVAPTVPHYQARPNTTKDNISHQAYSHLRRNKELLADIVSTQNIQDIVMQQHEGRELAYAN